MSRTSGIEKLPQSEREWLETGYFDVSMLSSGDIQICAALAVTTTEIS